ncbi:hypothetical protein Hanom_Chr12g01126681 [Helianthus anomalus]
MFMENESLGDMSTRFYHLLSDMFSYTMTVTPQEITVKFVDALPLMWSGFLEILKFNDVLDNTNIYEFIQML